MILVAILFITIGIAVKHGKMYFLIAGYNTMSKEKKARYNIEGIANLFRNVMFGMALVILLGFFLAKLFNSSKFEDYTFLAALVFGIPYLLIQSNSKKYKV